MLSLHSAHPAQQCAKASNSTWTLAGWLRWSVAAPPAHPSNCTRLWCSKIPTTQHSQDLPLEAEMRCPGPHHKETDSLERLRQVQRQGHCSWIFFSCSVPGPLHLHQDLADCSLSSSIPAVCGVPITRYFCCHFATSGALIASHQRINVGISAIGLSLVTFLGNRKNIVVHACCGHFPPFSTFSMNSTISSHVSFVQSKGTFGSHPTPVFALYHLETFSNSHSFNLLAALPPIFSPPHFPKLFLHVLHIFVTLPVLCQFFPLCFTTVQQPDIVFFFFFGSAFLLSKRAS